MAHKHSVADDGDPRKYYAAIPNIVLSLGLHPFELALYAYLKKVAGESGVCWKSRATIAKEIKMSAGMVSKCKDALAMPRPELNGKPLIVVSEQMQNGGNANHSITITDIWPENMAELERIRLEKARSQSDGVNVTRSPHDARGHTVTSTRSPHDHKEEPLKKNPEEDLRGFPFNHFAVIEYTETFNPDPALAISQAEVIANNVPDSDLGRAVWSNTLRTFKGNGYQARYAGNAVDRFLQEMAAIRAGKKDSPVTTERTKTLREKIHARETQR